MTTRPDTQSASLIIVADCAPGRVAGEAYVSLTLRAGKKKKRFIIRYQILEEIDA